MVTALTKKTFTTKRNRSTSGVRFLDFPSTVAVTVFLLSLTCFTLTEVNLFDFL